jgi:lysozyme
MNLSQMIELHEGRRQKLYKCTAGKWTIGVGRNIEDRGLSNPEIDFLRDNDLALSRQELTTKLPWFVGLDPVRQAVLIDMHFNMGWPVLSTFKNTLEYIRKGENEKAATAMLQSKWASQVGNRAKRLAKMMQWGSWPADL